jgi:hypothetical protein
MTWWPALLGWPAIALAVVIAAIGAWRRNEFIVLAAIVPVAPIGFYVLGSPLYWWLPVAVLLLLLGLSWFIRLRRRDHIDG